MRRQIVTGVRMILVMTVLVGLVYPLVVTALAQVGFRKQANGSMVRAGGREVGSSLIGQGFTSPGYFQPRPSSAGTNGGYDAMASGASNLGPSNKELVDNVTGRVADYRRRNRLPNNPPVPVDAVTSSGSGLDPDISVANARLQAPRVAEARRVPQAMVLALVDRHTSGRGLGFLGERRVNVLELNLALDRLVSGRP